MTGDKAWLIRCRDSDNVPDVVAAVAAPTQGRARYRAHQSAHEAGYLRATFADFTVQRWPTGDRWAEQDTSKRLVSKLYAELRSVCSGPLASVLPSDE